MKELYHEEQKILSDYVAKLKKKSVHLEDAVGIAVNYKDLLDQSKVITKISDRLQKKLDHANQKIKSQNVEIQDKNQKLEDTVENLAKVTVGKKASRLMFGLAVGLFFVEETFLAPVIDELVDEFIGLLIKGLVAVVVLKFLESALESYFMNREKAKIMNEKLNSEGEISNKIKDAKRLTKIKSNSAA
jgi:hypothetical protein